MAPLELQEEQVVIPLDARDIAEGLRPLKAALFLKRFNSPQHRFYVNADGDILREHGPDGRMETVPGLSARFLGLGLGRRRKRIEIVA